MTRPATLYLAYGSNLHRRQMQRRCPLAHALCRVTVPGFRLEFRDYADLSPQAGARALGAIYRLTPRCEASLDRHEGVATRSYRKTYMNLRCRDLGEVQVLVYRKAPGPLGLPPSWYLATVAEGYREWGMPLDTLRAAVARAARDALADDEAGVPAWNEEGNAA